MRTTAFREGPPASFHRGISRRLLLGVSASAAALMPAVAHSQTPNVVRTARAADRRASAIIDLTVNNQVLSGDRSAHDPA